jgi:hypothetical protein
MGIDGLGMFGRRYGKWVWDTGGEEKGEGAAEAEGNVGGVDL